MKAALQDSAKACSRLSEALASPSKLWKTSPPTVMVGGQLAGLDGDDPCSMRSAEVTTLKVDPGGKDPARALSKPSEAGSLTDASTSPVDAWMATRAAGWVTPARADSAACCTVGSMVVRTGVPGWAVKRATVATVAPLPLCTVMAPPGVPASW